MLDFLWVEAAVTVAATALVVVLIGRRAIRSNHGHTRLLVGFLLYTTGLAFFPLVWQAYDATANWGLTTHENFVLWYAISTPLIVLGVLLFKPRGHLP